MKYRVSFGECALEDGLCIEHPNQLGIKVEKDEIHRYIYMYVRCAKHTVLFLRCAIHPTEIYRRLLYMDELTVTACLLMNSFSLEACWCQVGMESIDSWQTGRFVMS